MGTSNNDHHHWTSLVYMELFDTCFQRSCWQRPTQRQNDSPTLKQQFKRNLQVETETLIKVSMPVKSLKRLKPKQTAQPTSLMLLSTCRAEERRTGIPFLHPASLASNGRKRDAYLDVVLVFMTSVVFLYYFQSPGKRSCN